MLNKNKTLIDLNISPIFIIFRNKSVQMNEQINAIESFENFLNPLRIIFADESGGDRIFTLNAFVIRQRYFLHGYESRNLKYIPKVEYFFHFLL